MVISSIKPHKPYSNFPNSPPNTTHTYDTGIKNNTRTKLWQSHPLNHRNSTHPLQTRLSPRTPVARVLKIIPANNRKQSIVSWGEDSSTDTNTNTDTDTNTDTNTDINTHRHSHKHRDGDDSRASLHAEQQHLALQTKKNIKQDIRE